ncbi:MAG: glycosyltransferase family 2 protein [Anaerorhabdus sp.]|uniref:glycosyltransferase family 2 protein n=1 Tax=Anaerorhabdus sp. TaxID=1872524 RepID=UPI002FC707B3
MSKLSIIIPVYFNEDNLLLLYEDLKSNVITKVKDYEIIFVDDGSKDDSWGVMNKIAMNDINVKCLKLSRNFGSHAAILAGLSYSTGNCAVIKAADMQEPSSIIIEMYKKWEEGNEVVLAVRKEREDKSLFSKIYYSIIKKFIFMSMPSDGFDIYLIDRKVIKEIDSLNEKNSALTLQILWCGFKTTEVEYIRKKREIGTSKWTLKKKIKLVVDSIVSFSYVPIRFMSFVGLLFFVISIIWMIYVLIAKIIGSIAIEGYTTLIILILFSSGLIMLTLGILGEYIWRILDSSRNRPVYIVSEKGENYHDNDR